MDDGFDSSTPAGRRAQFSRIIGKTNALSTWETYQARHYRDAVRVAAMQGAQPPAAPRPGSTPESRAAQMAALVADQLRAERRREDAAHEPGSTASTCFARVEFWEGRLAECEDWWNAAHERWCDETSAAGEFPAPAAAAAVRLAEAERSRLADECSRYRQLRDQALAECNDLRDWSTEGWR